MCKYKWETFSILLCCFVGCGGSFPVLFPFLAICVPLQKYVCKRERWERRESYQLHCWKHAVKPCIHKSEF